jgi:hypothetical protein
MASNHPRGQVLDQPPVVPAARSRGSSGAGDYAIVYDLNGSRGDETRLARFRVPDR